LKKVELHNELFPVRDIPDMLHLDINKKEIKKKVKQTYGR